MCACLLNGLNLEGCVTTVVEITKVCIGTVGATAKACIDGTTALQRWPFYAVESEVGARE